MTTFRIQRAGPRGGASRRERIPMMPDDRLRRLAENIELYGRLVPILLQKVNGEILVIDGRNRLRAAELAGIDPDVTDSHAHP